MVNPPIKNGGELDWTTVQKAAKAIQKAAEDGWFKPPEATSDHFVLIGRVCEAMNAISDALKLRKSNKHELTATDECSLFNSPKAYADGFVRISCCCGWQSNPIKSRDSATIFSAHVMQSIQEQGK